MERYTKYLPDSVKRRIKSWLSLARYSWYLFGSGIAFTAFAVLMAITGALGLSALLPFNFGVLSGALIGTYHCREQGALAMLKALLKSKGRSW